MIHNPRKVVINIFVVVVVCVVVYFVTVVVVIVFGSVVVGVVVVVVIDVVIVVNVLEFTCLEYKIKSSVIDIFRKPPCNSLQY